MDSLSNLKITSNKPLSLLCLSLGLTTFKDVCNHVKKMPYGRNSSKSDFSLVILEQKGTCSTKHGFLSQVAIENDLKQIKLLIGIYKMNHLNTTGIGTILLKHHLDYIPEAHTYLKVKTQRFDFTSLNSKTSAFEDSLLHEEFITPKQIGDYKQKLHKQFIKRWIHNHAIQYSSDELWDIREQCIFKLSQ